jgi:lambda repressor-like predicted transcriptional regulator
MYLFSFIMTYRGGIYISQELAKDLESAKNKWVDNLIISEIKYFGTSMQKELKREIGEDESTLIRGMKNLWINNYIIKGGFINVHIIKTAK